MGGGGFTPRQQQLQNQTAPGDVQSTTITTGGVATGLLKLHGELCQSLCQSQADGRVCPQICTRLCPSTCSSSSSSSSVTPPMAEPHGAPKPPHVSSILIGVSLSLLLAAAFILFAFLAIRKLHANRTRRGQRSEPVDPTEVTTDEFVVDHPIWYIRTVGLQPSIINGIAVVRYKKENGGLIEGTDCAVCLSEFQDDESLRLLPECDHAFHLPCIDTWLSSHTTCPVCRAGVVKDDNNTSVHNPADTTRHEARIQILHSDDREPEGPNPELLGINNEPTEEKMSRAAGGVGTNMGRRSVSMDFRIGGSSACFTDRNPVAVGGGRLLLRSGSSPHLIEGWKLGVGS